MMPADCSHTLDECPGRLVNTLSKMFSIGTGLDCVSSQAVCSAHCRQVLGFSRGWLEALTMGSASARSTSKYSGRSRRSGSSQMSRRGSACQPSSRSSRVRACCASRANPRALRLEWAMASSSGSSLEMMRASVSGASMREPIRLAASRRRSETLLEEAEHSTSSLPKSSTASGRVQSEIPPTMAYWTWRRQRRTRTAGYMSPKASTSPKSPPPSLAI
mmetsp:Transcript_46614/g.110475  ORF Transcript_46614/g.110475 Transcript_46614/m.110475 type:complete len:218 (+) Transcript_46614:308-961(+)